MAFRLQSVTYAARGNAITNTAPVIHTVLASPQDPNLLDLIPLENGESFLNKVIDVRFQAHCQDIHGKDQVKRVAVYVLHTTPRAISNKNSGQTLRQVHCNIEQRHLLLDGCPEIKRTMDIAVISFVSHLQKVTKRDCYFITIPNTEAFGFPWDLPEHPSLNRELFNSRMAQATAKYQLSKWFQRGYDARLIFPSNFKYGARPWRSSWRSKPFRELK